jgi:uncharacterized lipoprotein YbaY
MRRLLAVSALALLASCSSPGPYREAVVSGNVRYDQKIAFGPDAVLLVWVADASGPEAPLEVELQKLSSPTPGAELVAYDSVEGAIVSPTPFSLPVPMDKVDQGHDYALKAAIVDRGRPVMATTNAPLVLTRGRPLQADLTVSPVAAP